MLLLSQKQKARRLIETSNLRLRKLKKLLTVRIMMKVKMMKKSKTNRIVDYKQTRSRKQPKLTDVVVVTATMKVKRTTTTLNFN